MERYYLAIQSLSATLMRIFALAFDPPERFFDDKVDKHVSNLVAFHDPPLTQPPLPDQLRGSVHTDFAASPSCTAIRTRGVAGLERLGVAGGPGRAGRLRGQHRRSHSAMDQ